MKKLELSQLELVEAGKLGSQGTYFTGLMCGMTGALLFTGVFACLAGATGPACAIGLYAMNN